MGELHLEIIVDRLLREFKVGANVGKPPSRIQRDNQDLVKGRREIYKAERWTRTIRSCIPQSLNLFMARVLSLLTRL